MKMLDRTRLAEGGLQYKAGATRRIAVTIEEGLFQRLKKQAVNQDRSLSAVVVRIIQRSMRIEPDQG